MSQRLFWITVSMLASCLTLRAQNTLTTQVLSTSPICPGSTIAVPFTRTGTYNANNTFTVQLSDGSDYKNIETGTVTYSSSTNIYTATATIPSSTPAGTTYSLRITASSPAVIGTPSATKLTVKTKPIAPTVDALILTCQQRTGNDFYTSIDVKILSGAKAKLYNSNLSLNTDQTFSVGSPTSVYFQIQKGLMPDNGFQYPIAENTFYVTQTVDGCESDKVATLVRTLYRPSGGPTPANQVAGGYGRVTYCQGEKSYPLDVNGHKSPPENYRVAYLLSNGSTSSTIIPPTPDTSVPGDATYTMSLVPIDGTKGCSSAQRTETYLNVKVNARPGKPTIPANAVSLCQFQPTSPLSASVTDASASLVWYGSSATGGTGSASTIQPSTASSGTFKYYVAQKLNDCEGERAEITVEIKAASPAPTVSSATYCQGTPANPLSASAVGGGSLTWYTSPSGGTGTSTPQLPPTNTAGIQTYYVTQTMAGSCESQRIPMTVTVTGIPAAPTLPTNPYVSCQYAQGDLLTANGQNLKWYEAATGGTGVGSVTPNTSVAGTKLYYVSQTVSGCEGPRSALTVNILSAPAAPTVTQSTYEFCQGTTNATISGSIAAGSQTSWYIYGDEPGLLNSYTSGSTAYAVISTVQARTLTYSLFQIATNGCKGPASQQITITIKPTPSAPTVQSLSICQNALAPALQPVGENLTWYTIGTGGSGSTITPTVSTSQAGQTTYFVSQSINGCEGPRAALTVTINAIPAAPAVAASGPAYCQNTEASSLTATGQGLNWYREATGGTSLGDQPLQETKDAGSFTYYVSQTINGCEGPRSSLTVKVSAAPPAPTATSSYTYCQNTAAVALSATGSSAFKWYTSTGVTSNTAPTPLTDTPGTVSYFVTQTADNCESIHTEIKVTTKLIPFAPGTPPVLACQNDPTQTLLASGQNLLWYSAETGGTGVATTPVLNSGQAGQTNYYVSQTVDGCEGPRAKLAVTIKSLPVAPLVAAKDICQFAKPESLSATGVGLTWYNPDGSKGPSSPVPATDKGGVFSYSVTQTLDGCEGPKAIQTITVLTTPSPTVSKTTVELCQGAIAQPLEAMGTNLRWTDPSGVVSTTAPVPPTVNTTIKAEGDTYYVTQTGANGCESPKVGIKVFIQTTPTATILGTTSTNLGLEVPLKLVFTGVGPYRFKLSTGQTGTATKDTTLMVLPERTTVYQIAEVANKCGVGSSANSITITVRIPTIQTLALTSTTICAGTSLLTNFASTGEFNPGSVFKLQIAKVDSDSTKAIFTDVPGSQLGNGQLSGTLPGTTSSGVFWVRVVATNPKIPIIGTISPTRLVVRSPPTALLTGDQAIYEGQPASLSVAFTGEGPWGFTYHDSTATAVGAPKTIQSNTNPYVFESRPTKTTAYYLTSVSNGCGTVTRTASPVLVKVNVLLGIEDQTLLDALDVFPVPATTTLTVTIRGLSSTHPALLTLTDMAGRTTFFSETRRQLSTIALDQYPAGIYILRIQIGDRTASKRIVKL